MEDRRSNYSVFRVEAPLRDAYWIFAYENSPIVFGPKRLISGLVIFVEVSTHHLAHE